MTIESILITGLLVFIVSSIYFYFRPKKPFNSALLVSLTTLFSYLVMIEGRFLLDGSTPSHHWTRWVFYAVSCPLLAYEIGKQLKFDLNKTIKNVFLIFLVMITGAMAAISDGVYMWIYFIFSASLYGQFIFDVFRSKATQLPHIAPYIIFGWTLFPIVFIFSPEGLDLISGVVSVFIYLALDIATKIVFYITAQYFHPKDS